MTQAAPTHGLQLRSKVTSDGQIEISLEDAPVAQPDADEVLIRVEAAPINPSDLGLLLGAADPAGAKASGTAERPVVTVPLTPAMQKAMAPRAGLSMPVGNEGAGVVVAAGDQAKALIGKTVAIFGGAMYAQYRVARAADCLVLPDDATPTDGASCFVNPLTALGFLETMRLEGHTGLVHTAAASNLGQMLVKICLADGVPLVNIVRKPDQAELLRKLGARYVCDSSAPSFQEDLVKALKETGATLAFDAVGGGRLAGQILAAMETAAVASGAGVNPYGSNTHKQVYVYGALDMGPTEFTRTFGFAWGIGGWLLMPLLARIGAEGAARLRARVVAELKTTFASHYTAEVSLAEALKPDVMAAYARKATGEKFLIKPNA